MSKPNTPIASYFYNPVSLIGIVLATAGTGLILIFLAMEVIAGKNNPYLGILVYFVFPVMLILGLILMPIGAFRARARMRRTAHAEIPSFPVIDLNDSYKRRLFIFFAVATFLFVIIVSFASIQGYEFSESTVFCGKLCHVVMEPEYTTWSNSPHAEVKCVECHVGSGAKWYVKAKLSGLRQVYAVLTKSYAAPIKTPIENLRPARETCEHCHWPEKFYAGQQKIFYHYAPDESNTPREINMLLKVGSTRKDQNSKGIHWHIGSKVSYIATDRKRMEIPYIAVQEKDGKITEYISTEKPIAKDRIAAANKRFMDCLDCHNRPTHIFYSLGQAMDEAFVSGRIDPSLPYVKKVAVDLLEKPYKTTAEAEASIASGIHDYYNKNYSGIAVGKRALIDQAIDEVKAIYKRNFFPAMKVSWNTYPNNIGHFYTPGCFRCHDGKHKSSDGRVISKDCNICHTVLSQKQENIPSGTVVKGFVHPEDIGDDLYETNCSDCHSAGGHDVPGSGD